MTGKKKESFYLPDETVARLDSYITDNYKPSEMYGARSSVVNQAISYFCSTADTGGEAPYNKDFIDLSMLGPIPAKKEDKEDV